MISFELDEDVLAIQEMVRKFAETELREAMREAERVFSTQTGCDGERSGKAA